MNSADAEAIHLLPEDFFLALCLTTQILNEYLVKSVIRKAENHTHTKTEGL